jgi:xanthine dehydrogenase YagS FAD-binding subunit
MILLDAEVHTRRPDGTARSIPFAEFHRAPGNAPDAFAVLEHGELITHVTLPPAPIARRSYYLKVRDRASYEFALASAAVALDLDGSVIRSARLALGGVATKPWRCPEAEALLTGRRGDESTFREAAEAALATAVGRKHNQFKIELARRTIVRAFACAQEMTP